MQTAGGRSATAARLRLRRAPPSRPARRPVRRGAHGLVPVLLAARRGGATQAVGLPNCGRLVRGLDGRVLAPTSGRSPAVSVGASSSSVCAPSSSAFCFSALHERRLLEYGVHGEVTILRGLYEGQLSAPAARPVEPVIVFAGRHIPEKRVLAIVPAVAHARREVPELRCLIFGDGPDRDRVLMQIGDYGLAGVIEAPGFVPSQRIDSALRGGALSRLAVESRRLRARCRRSRGTRDAERRRGGPRQCSRRADQGRCQRRRRSVGVAPRSRSGNRLGPPRRPHTAGGDCCVVRPRSRPGSRWVIAAGGRLRIRKQLRR